jgi:hypothetical protein
VGHGAEDLEIHVQVTPPGFMDWTVCGILLEENTLFSGRKIGLAE